MDKRERELAEAIDFEATHWHVVVLRRDGKLKVRKNLTLDQARGAVRELAPNQRPRTYILRPDATGVVGKPAMPLRAETAQDAVEVHILGPKGAALHAWADVEPANYDVTSEVRST